MIANIASDDALLLPHRANPAGLNFRERQRSRSSRVASGLDPSIGVFRSQEEAKQQNHRAADVRRFAYLINTNEIFGTHTDPARGPHHIWPVLSGVHPYYCRI
jgi:hypothetical protein